MKLSVFVTMVQNTGRNCDKFRDHIKGGQWKPKPKALLTALVSSIVRTKSGSESEITFILIQGPQAI